MSQSNIGSAPLEFKRAPPREPTGGPRTAPGHRRLSSAALRYSPKQHLRNMSTVSTASLPLLSPGGARRVGINLGFSVVGNTPTDLSPMSTQSETRRSSINIRQSPPWKSNIDRIESTTSSPIRSSTLSPLNDQSSARSSVHVPEPRSKELSDRFRHLATKEMELLDINNTIKRLEGRRNVLDTEIKGIKSDLEQQLVKKMTLQSLSEARERSSSIPVNRYARTRAQSQLPTPDSRTSTSSYFKRDSSSGPSSKRSSWLTRPMSFLQQFDNMVTQELDRIDMADPGFMGRQSTDSGSSLNSRGLPRPVGAAASGSNVDSSGREISGPLKSLADAPPHPDIVQSVSQHLWSFVNEVKSNLLLDEENTQPPTQESSAEELVPLASPPDSDDLEEPANTNATSSKAATHNAAAIKGNRDSASSEFDLWEDEDLLDL